MGQPPVPYTNSTVEVPCIPDSMIDCSETIGLVIFILNIVSPPLGTTISSCVDKKGCNCTAFCVAILQSFTFYLCGLGWIWAIIHGYRIYQANMGKQWDNQIMKFTISLSSF